MRWFSLWIFPRILNMSVLWEVQFCGLSWFFFQWSLVRWHHKDSSRNIWKLYFAAIPVSTRDVFMLHVACKLTENTNGINRESLFELIPISFVLCRSLANNSIRYLSRHSFRGLRNLRELYVLVLFYFYFHRNVWWQLRLFDIKYFWASFALALTLAGSLFNEKLL